MLVGSRYIIAKRENMSGAMTTNLIGYDNETSVLSAIRINMKIIRGKAASWSK